MLCDLRIWTEADQVSTSLTPQGRGRNSRIMGLELLHSVSQPISFSLSYVTSRKKLKFHSPRDATIDDLSLIRLHTPCFYSADLSSKDIVLDFRALFRSSLREPTCPANGGQARFSRQQCRPRMSSVRQSNTTCQVAEEWRGGMTGVLLMSAVSHPTVNCCLHALPAICTIIISSTVLYLNIHHQF